VSAATTLASQPTEIVEADGHTVPAVVGPVQPRAECTSTPAPALPDDRLALSIAEVAERTGVTAHTLRYYERIGLVSVPRDAAGHRVYTQIELARVVFITRLRLTAMPIRDIQAYFRLVAAGPGNEHRRLALLEAHRDQVKARIAELESALGVVEYKIAAYGGDCVP
jgi:DNA-binding transcriptional MerR regulator